MVDTMTIYHKFKKINEYKNTIKSVNTYIENKNINCKLHLENKKLITYAFARYGIEELSLKSNKECGYYVIIIKLRPKLMVEAENYIDIIRYQDIMNLFNKFDRFIHYELGLNELPHLKIWKVKRIDYAIDIRLKQENIPYYIDLFKRANIPENLLNDSTTKMYWDKKNNLYLKGKNYTINFYDRYTTLCTKQSNTNKHFKNIEAAIGILRFEVQVRVDSDKLKRRGLIKENSVEQLMTVDLCKYYVLRNYEKIIGKGEYYTYHIATNKCKTESQRELIYLIHKTGSIHEAKKVYLNENKDKRKAEKRFSKIINELYNRNINPVLLENVYVESLYNQLSSYFDNAKRVLITRRRETYE